MSEDERSAVEQLARESTQGRKLSAAEMFFCSDILDKHPDEYREIYKSVFVQTGQT